MAKKIFDIIPPGYSEPKEKKQSFNWADKGSKPRASQSPDERPAQKRSSLPGIMMVFLVLGLAAIGAAYFLIDAKASVVIWPRQEAIAKGPDQVSLKDGISQIDFERKIIPALLIEKTKTYSETVSSTGAVGSKAKATGTIRLYNEFEPPKPFTFVKGTRFVSSVSDGKIFKALADIKLPAATYDKGKLVASYIDVQVEAAEGGSAYNIPVSNFSIPGLSGTISYASVWGKSEEAMKGGSETGAKTVTKEDLERAKKQFADNSFQKAKQDLMAAVPAGSVFVDKFMSQEADGDQTFTAKEKDPRDTFDISGEITSRVLVFKESDISAYAENLVSRTLSVKRIVPGSLKASYDGDSVDFSQKTAKLELSVSAKTYTLDDEQGIEDSLRGQSLDAARSMFDNSVEIEKADIKITPFWKNSLPADPSKMEIKISFDEQ